MTGKASILFVDDEKRVLNAMRGLFRRSYELFLTTDGAEALRMAHENDIDVVVADQRMPGLTGIEVLGKLKEISPRTVRILLTGYADPNAVEGSINIGEVFRFLSKPCPPALLRETLSLAIAASRTAPAATQPPVATVRADTQSLIESDEDTQPAMPALTEADIAARNEQSEPHWQSVTNVIMSADAVEETQEQPALTPSGPGVRDVGIVIFTVDSDFASAAIRATSMDKNTILATTLVKVARAIEEQHAGVLVTDFTTNNTMLQKMIGTLKQFMPHLVTIVASNGRDTTDMINLINYGQVFRYVLKPVEPEDLRVDINAAVSQHLYLLSNPDAAKRHQVIATPSSDNDSSSMNKFLGDIRGRRDPRSDPTDTIA